MMAELGWALQWLVALIMVSATVATIYGGISLGWYVYYWVELQEDVKDDKAKRLDDKREQDRKFLALQYEQQVKMLTESGMIYSPEEKATTSKSIGRVKG